MAKRHKKFGVATATEYDPLSFDLGGQEFFCRPAVSGVVILKFVKEADSGSGGRSAGALLGLFNDVLLPDERERFTAYIEDPDNIIEISTLGEIAAWVVEQYSEERPTQESSDSSAGRKSRGRSLTGASSAEE